MMSALDKRYLIWWTAMTGLDPRSKQGGHEIWNSLNWVYCRLIDEG